MSGFDRGAISIIEPGHAKYDDLDVLPGEGGRHKSTRFYDQLLVEYNKCEVGSIMIFDLPDTIKFFNLRNVFSGRGLVVGEDIVVARQEFDADGELLPNRNRPVKIKKLSKTEAKIIDRRLLSEED